MMLQSVATVKVNKLVLKIKVEFKKEYRDWSPLQKVRKQIKEQYSEMT